MASIEENLGSIAESLRELVKLASVSRDVNVPCAPDTPSEVTPEKPVAKKAAKAVEKKAAPVVEPDTATAFDDDEPVVTETEVRATLQDLAKAKGVEFAQALLKEKGKMDSPVLKNLSKDRYAAVIAAAKVHLG